MLTDLGLLASAFCLLFLLLSTQSLCLSSLLHLSEQLPPMQKLFLSAVVNYVLAFNSNSMGVWILWQHVDCLMSLLCKM